MNHISPHRSESYPARIILFIVLAFLVLTYLHNIARMLIVERNFGDFANYYFFSQQLNEGKDIYSPAINTDPEVLKQGLLFGVKVLGVGVYSSLFYVMMTPLTRLPFWPANLIWLLLNQLALVVCLWLSALILKQKSRIDLILLSVIGVVFFASQPLLENVGIGQINIPILLLLILIAYFVGQDKNFNLAGVFLAFLMLLKPQFGLLLLFFLWKRRYAFCLSALIAYVVFRLAGVIICGWNIEISYWHNLLYFFPAEANISNISLKGIFGRFFFNTGFYRYCVLFYIAVSLALGFLTFLRTSRRENKNFLLEYSSLICLILLVSPLTENHHLILTDLPFIIAIYNLKPARSTFAWLAIAFLLISVRYSLASFRFFDTGTPSILSWGKTAGVFLLWCLFIRHLSRERDFRDF